MFSALQKALLHDLASTDANRSLSTDSTDFQLQLGTFISGTPNNSEIPCWAPYLSEPLILMEKKVHTALLFMNKLLLYPWKKVHA